MTSTMLSLARATALRRKLFTPAAMAHPAKMHVGFCMELVERYTKPGDTILAPMGGIGTTLVAALLGRNVVLVERESHFIRAAAASWAKTQIVGPMQGHAMGHVMILQGDARALPFPSAGGGEVILTSPPYGEAQSGGGIAVNGHAADPGLARRAYSKQAFDTVLSSPPYEASLQGSPSSVDVNKAEEPARWGASTASQLRLGPNYTQLAAVLTSPPYDEGLGHQGDNERPIVRERAIHGGSAEYSPSKGAKNIGNLSGAAYWRAMEQVYRECWRVLRPGGVCIVVMGDIVRSGAVVPLVEQTRELLERMGFAYQERIVRQKRIRSFWRILQTTDKRVKTVATAQTLDGAAVPINRVKRVPNGAPSVDTETALVMRRAP